MFIFFLLSHAISLKATQPLGHAIFPELCNLLSHAISLKVTQPLGHAIFPELCNLLSHAIPLKVTQPLGHAISLSYATSDVLDMCKPCVAIENVVYKRPVWQ